MKIEDFENLEQYGAAVDQKNKCFVLPLENGSCIIGYFPLECVQLYVYDINGTDLPDLLEYGLRQFSEGNLLRTIACREGQIRMTRGNKKSILYRGEVSVEYTSYDNPIILSGNRFRGVETIMQPNELCMESLFFKNLMEKDYKINLQNLAVKNGPLNYFELSSKSKRNVDEIIRLALSHCNSTIMLLRMAELGHDYVNDFRATRSSLHYFVTPSQLQIAEDIHRALTDEFNKKWTAADFAEKYQLSETSVKKYFKIVYGYDFKEYKSKVRMEEARRLLGETDLTIGEISFRVGYATQAKFGEVFKHLTGFTPREYRQQAMVKNLRGQSGLPG